MDNRVPTRRKFIAAGGAGAITIAGLAAGDASAGEFSATEGQR